MPNDSDLSDRLVRFLGEVEPGRPVDVVSLEEIAGGMSRVTVKAGIRWADGARETLCIRGDPEQEGVFRSDRDAEWRLLQALGQVDEPVTPAPRWYDATGNYFGTKTIITDFCEGENLHRLLQDGIELEEKTTIFVDALASIHRTPLDVLPSEMATGEDWDTYIDRVLGSYVDAEQRLSTSNPIFRYLGAFLRTNRPPPLPLTFVHGDAQPGNVLVRKEERPVIVDWEFGRIADPREDLGYYAQIPMPPNLYSLDPEGFLAKYRRATGFSEHEVNVKTVDYFRMIGMAGLAIQLAEGADSLSVGAGGGLLATYLINAISHNCDEFVKASRRLEK